MKKLTVGYSVLADRAKNITPPQNADWEILIITQGGEAAKRIPQAKQLYLETTGVAKSRNVAIENGSGEYLVFADDDIVFSEHGLQEAITYLDQNQDVSLVLCRASDTEGKLRKNYPQEIEVLGLFKFKVHRFLQLDD